jgi:hypothetical protein
MGNSFYRRTELPPEKGFPFGPEGEDVLRHPADALGLRRELSAEPNCSEVRRTSFSFVRERMT